MALIMIKKINAGIMTVLMFNMMNNRIRIIQILMKNMNYYQGLLMERFN